MISLRPRHLFLGLALFAGLALAVSTAIQSQPTAFTGGLWVGSTASKTATNRVTNLVSGSIAWDVPPLAANTCTDSTTVTVTGAAVGDPCKVGVTWALLNTAIDAGTGNLNNGDAGSTMFECFVTVANTAVVRACSHAAVQDPSDAGFRVWVMSNQ